MSEPADFPDMQDFELQTQDDSEAHWKFDHLIKLHELASMLNRKDADEYTTSLAERCGLGKEFRQYLTERK